jgi:hypothetical protein
MLSGLKGQQIKKYSARPTETGRESMLERPELNILEKPIYSVKTSYFCRLIFKTILV